MERRNSITAPSPFITTSRGGVFRSLPSYLKLFSLVRYPITPGMWMILLWLTSSALSEVSLPTPGDSASSALFCSSSTTSPVSLLMSMCSCSMRLSFRCSFCRLVRLYISAGTTVSLLCDTSSTRSAPRLPTRPGSAPRPKPDRCSSVSSSSENTLLGSAVMGLRVRFRISRRASASMPGGRMDMELRLRSRALRLHRRENVTCGGKSVICMLDRLSFCSDVRRDSHAGTCTWLDPRCRICKSTRPPRSG
mmetsp:Transcript_33003/g.82969  ORF Transcript_33003/g.82969 Transcript_33003/m.82969 type:complete len:250 (-) Transcript_33003:2123-2872(-)